MKKDKKVGLYMRVSTKDQSCEMQLNDLQRYSKERGFEVFKIYRDDGISGSKESRPALNELMDDARKKKFNTVLVWDFSRYARSSKHLINSLHEFRNLGIDFISYRENIDTSSAIGKAVFVIISAMSELEKNIISERVTSGMKRAKEKGRAIGRPRAYLDVEEVKRLKGEGYNITEISRILNVSRANIYRKSNGYLNCSKGVQKN